MERFSVRPSHTPCCISYWVKRWRKFVEGGVDAKRDRDVLMDSGQGTRCPPRWHRMQDSNLRQPVLETGALPNRHMRLKNFVQFS